MAAANRLSFHVPESRVHYAPPMEFKTLHTKIELTLDMAGKKISGSCTQEISPVKKGLARARFDAVGFDVYSVEVDGTQAEFEYDGETLSVALGGKPGSRKVKVGYSATPVAGVYFTVPDKEYPDREVQAWTHSEAEDARHWFPCHDHPADKPTSELILKVPKEYRVISNGKLVSSATEGETTTFHWLEEVPHSCYLTSFVVGKFSTITQESRGVKLNYNFAERDRESVLGYFGETPKMIEVFEDLLGVKYPYLKYDQTTVEEFVAGGEENLNATTLATHYYPRGYSEDDFAVSYALSIYRPMDLVSHELAHQWFGDLVTCADWAHAWLNEGFASYFQELYLEKTRGVDEMIWHLNTRCEEYFDEAAMEYRRPIVERDYVWPDDIFDSHLYPKGAAMLHQLRFLVGDDSFFAGLSLYLKKHARSTADTHDFRKAMEEASGAQLEEFFEQSFYRPGHPEFDVDYSWDEAASLATLRVKQTQNADDGTPVYKLPCELVFRVGGENVTRRVDIQTADQSFTFSFPSKPTSVEFDPRRWLLRRTRFEKSIDLLLGQLSDGASAHSRTEAAKELGRMKAAGAVRGLTAAAGKEQHWLVRAGAFRALGEIGSGEALEALLSAPRPEDRRARRGLVAALGSFKDKRAAGLLLKFLEEDPSPYVKSEAALGLAKALGDEALPHLKKAMLVSSPNETLAEACVSAMGKLNGEEPKRVIAESLAYGKPPRVRAGALRAIKERGKILDSELPVLKEMLVHDREYRVKLFMLDAVLLPLKDVRFVDALRECSKTSSHYMVRRKALNLYHRFSALQENREAVEELRAEVERLKERSQRA